MGFTAGVRPDLITPVVAGKLIAGVLAVILAILMTKNDTAEAVTVEENAKSQATAD